MKKTLTLLLCAALILGAFGGFMSSAKAEPTSYDGTHTPEYGEKRTLQADVDGYSAEIDIPIGSIEVLDAVLEKWADVQLSKFEPMAKKETADAEGMKATVYVTYDSFVLNDRYIGVKLIGVYLSSDKTHREDIVYTVNYDKQTGKVLTFNDVFRAANADALGLLIGEETIADGNNPVLAGASAATAKQMGNFVLRSDGVEFLLTGENNTLGDYLVGYDKIADYMLMFDPEPTAAPTPVPNVTNDTVTVVGIATCKHNGVHVRAQASTKSAILAVVQAGALLNVTKDDAGNGWTQIWYADNYAYIASRYISFENETDEGPTVEETGHAAEEGYVTGSSVHVRAEATTRSKLLGTVKYGDKLEVLVPYYTDNWHEIKFDGGAAYISAQYVSLGEAPSVTPKPEQVGPKIVSGPPSIEFVGTCNTDGVVIRSKCSTHSDYYDKLYYGDEVQVMRQEYREGWDKVWIPTNHHNTKGYVGYVHSRYIEDESNVVPVVQATPTPRLIPVVQVTPTPIPVITYDPALVTGQTVPGWQIGSGVTVP